MADPSVDRLIDALARLRPEDRRVLELSVGEGRSDGEVAAQTGIAADEVMWRRAELVNAVAADAGNEGPQATLAVAGALGRLPPQAWKAANADPATRQTERAAEEAADGGGGWPPVAQRIGIGAILMLPGALTVYLSFNGGGFFPATTAVAVLVTIVALLLRVTLAEQPFEGVGPPLAVAGVALGLFAVWTLLSFAWSEADARALLEFDRALLYMLVLVLAGSLLRTQERVRWMVRGIAAGTFVVCSIALVTRVLPEVWPIESNIANERLAYPITYWNALGLLAALGAVMSLFLACDEREPPVSRALGAAALPVFGPTLLLTGSRSGIAVAVLGLAAFMLLGRPRGLLPGLLAAGPATALAVVLTYRADLLPTDRYTTPAAVAQGEDAALAIVVCAAGALAIRMVLLPADRVLARVLLARRLRRSVIGAVAGVTLLTTIVLALSLDAPGYAQRQYDRFLDGSGVTNERSRLTNPANNGRLDLWRVARDSWRRERLHGAGAGTYQTLWARNRPTSQEVIDGHSLYLEILAELGVVGLVLIVVALGAVLARLAYLARGDGRPLYGALLAIGLMWALHAGVDWDWEMPAVTVPVLALGGLALAAGTGGGRPPARLTRVLIGICLLVVGVSPVLIASSQSRLNESVRAFRQGDCDAAVDRALSSVSALGVRPEPYEIIAYCDARRRGANRLGVQMMEEAVKRDPDNWEFRYGLALVRGAAGLDPRPAARAAQRLNPRSRLARKALERFDTDDPREWERRARSARLSL
ncbi:MAG: O-antigen ligase family protein [Actinomycetota bacterium]|nr:O-antigen ligase family protein [Actinomycetota bacterium]